MLEGKRICEHNQQASRSSRVSLGDLYGLLVCFVRYDNMNEIIIVLLLEHADYHQYLHIVYHL